MKTRQQRIDELTIKNEKAVGADNRGGQDKIDPQRFKPSMLTSNGQLPQESRKSIMGPLKSPYKADSDA